jgi:hypothetical protein
MFRIEEIKGILKTIVPNNNNINRCPLTDERPRVGGVFADSTNKGVIACERAIENV